MKCINFDRAFERYMAEWIKENSEKYKDDMDVIEDMMPDVYLEFLKKPADFLDGVAPQDYFEQFDNADMLVNWLCDYIAQGVPVPDLLLELMLLTYRYIFLLLKTASSITAAQHSRLGNHSLSAARNSFAQMAGSVFLLSLKRSGAQYDAMESRCYDGVIRCLAEHHPAKLREILALVFFETGLLLITILTWR